LTSGNINFISCSIKNFLKKICFFLQIENLIFFEIFTLSLASSGPGLCFPEVFSRRSLKPSDDCESLFKDFSCCGFCIFHCFIKLHKKALLLTTPVKSESLNSLNNDSILVISLGNERNCSHTRLSISFEFNLPKYNY
jgi:hypothetical protein